MQTLTPELLTIVLAGALSLAFTLIPGLRVKFAELAEDVKKAIMAGLVALLAVAIYVLACVPELGFPYVACPTGGVWELLGTVFLAIMANQGIDRITPEPADVKAIKAAKAASGS